MPELVRTVGRYGIIREIGRGGMGVVYLAWQGDLERLVALKELSAFHAGDPTSARRFVRESRLAGSLTHTNVVTVFDYFEHDGTPYIAMEYLERGSLRPYLGDDELGLAQMGGVLDGLLAGLEAAAQRGIVHRDLKPENVMVGSDGGVKIADFGIAKATQGAQTSVLLTQTGAAVGTPAYMSPEQAMAKEVGPWTDLYAVGCIAYEMFTGKPPFHGAGTPVALLVRHVTDPLAPASEVAGVDPEISEWIERLTAKEPAQRPQSATLAREALEELLVARLGPLWRRQARLPEAPSRPAASTSTPVASSDEFASFAWRPAPPVPGPDTPPPTGPAPPLEGIDVEGTGPDTPAALPATEVSPPPPGRPAPAPPAVAPPTGEVQPAWSRSARLGGVGLLAALVIPIITSGFDRWNLFAVFSPFEAIGTALGTWLVVRALHRDRISTALAAGILVGFGALTTVAALGLLKFTGQRLGAPSVVMAAVVLVGAVAILTAGIAAIRASPGSATVTAVDPGTLLLGLAGVALAIAALFVTYDGFSSLWSEVGEGESAEFFFEPMIAAATALAGLVVLGTWPRFACGLLIAVGTALTLHFLGLIIAAWRAIGEVGDVGAAGFIGLLGGLLLLAAGAYAHRSGRDRA